MATTVEGAFRDFKVRLEITDRQEALVSQRRGGVVATLKRSLTLSTAPESLVIGSWDRHTLTRYLTEGDVDVMVILNYGVYKDWYNGPGTIKALDRFKAILDAAYPSTTKRRDRNCITMRFSEFRLDVVPAFRGDGDFYLIPDSVRQKWVQTAPTGFASRVTTVNQNTGERFVPLIKMVKAWNRENGWPIRSFHLECMLYDQCNGYTEAYSYPSMLKAFFDTLANRLASAAYDPVRGDQVDTYLDEGTPTRRSKAIVRAKVASVAAAKAYTDQERYPATAIGEWKALLGEFFPTYG